MKTIRTKQIVTRKPHVCFGCGRIFPAGSKMEFSVIVDGNTVFNDYVCRTCQQLILDYISNYNDFYCEYSLGSFLEGAIEYEKEHKDYECPAREF